MAQSATLTSLTQGREYDVEDEAFVYKGVTDYGKHRFERGPTSMDLPDCYVQELLARGKIIPTSARRPPPPAA